MNNDEMCKVAIELKSIFSNMPKELINKIPIEIRNMFIDIAAKPCEYKFKYDKTKTLNEQNISSKTKGILAYIYKEYLCNDLDKKKYNVKYYNYKEKQEEEKRKLYNPNNIFKK